MWKCGIFFFCLPLPSNVLSYTSPYSQKARQNGFLVNGHWSELNFDKGKNIFVLWQRTQVALAWANIRGQDILVTAWKKMWDETLGWWHSGKPTGVSCRPKSLCLLFLLLHIPISFAIHKPGLVLLASCPITAADESGFKVSWRKGERMALEAILVLTASRPIKTPTQQHSFPVPWKRFKGRILRRESSPPVLRPHHDVKAETCRTLF